MAFKEAYNVKISIFICVMEILGGVNNDWDFGSSARGFGRESNSVCNARDG